jgi:hypothetical protein
MSGLQQSAAVLLLLETGVESVGRRRLQITQISPTEKKRRKLSCFFNGHIWLLTFPTTGNNKAYMYCSLLATTITLEN